MQGNGDLQDKRRERQETIRKLRELNDEIERLEREREETKVFWGLVDGIKAVLAALSIAALLDWLRTHPRQAAAGVVATAAAASITAVGLPSTDDFSVVPGDEPPAAVGPTDEPSAKRAEPSPLPAGVDPAPTIGPSPPAGAMTGTGPTSAPATGELVPDATNSPAVTSTPSPPGTPDPSPTPTRPPPPPSEPTITATTSPPPTPTVTVTPSPTVTPTSTPTGPDLPEECLLYVDLPPLLEACLLDVSRGGEGQLLDGAIGGRGLFG